MTGETWPGEIPMMASFSKPNGKTVVVYPLTYGRARIQVFEPGELVFATDEW